MRVSAWPTTATVARLLLLMMIALLLMRLVPVILMLTVEVEVKQLNSSH
jgi:hypothetical protein